MKLFIKNRGKEVDLNQHDLVGTGGEGNVFARGKTAYKVYHDPKHMLPAGKIQELAVITDPFVVRPQDVLVNAKGTPVGYTTMFVPNAWTLCQLFPLAFRQREGLTPDAMRDLIKKLQERVSNVHAAGILIVDANEMNFLVGRKFQNVYCIDVDSYQTPHYPAQAIMDSIRDWSAQQFSELSDWYSYGILAFQMFIGVHPFKGRYHGKLLEFKGRLKTDAEDDVFAVTRRRMQASVSVFDPDVGIPGASLPLDTIPSAYRKWFEAVFAEGKRLPPPSAFDIVLVPVVLPVKAVTGTDLLDISEVGEYEGTVANVWSDGACLVVSTDKGVWLDAARTNSSPASHCGFSPKAGRAVATVAGPGSKTSLYNLTDRVDLGPLMLAVEEVSSYDGRIYVRTENKVNEIILTDAGAQVIVSTQEVVQTLPHATRLYSGVVIQRLLGTTYVSLLIQSGGALQVALKELDAYRVIDAKFDHGVLMVVGEKHGQYDRLVFRFDNSGGHDSRIVSGIAYAGLNFVTLDSGVCACLNEDEKLEVFSAKRGSTTIKYVEDPVLSGDMRLAKQAGQVLFYRGSKVYRMRLK
jgi:hypothetical protein